MGTLVKLNNALPLSQSILTAGSLPTDCRYVVEYESDLFTQEDQQAYQTNNLFKTDSGTTVYYHGLQVFAKDTQKVYILKKNNSNQLIFEELKTGSNINQEYIEDVVNNMDIVTSITLNTTLNNYVTQDSLTGQLTGLYRIKGVVNDVSNLPSLEKSIAGDVYNIRNKFSLETKLDDGTTTMVTYPPGTNVVCVITATIQEQEKNPETGEDMVDENNNPIMKDVQIKKWDTLGGTHEFDWIDLKEE